MGVTHRNITTARHEPVHNRTNWTSPDVRHSYDCDHLARKKQSYRSWRFGWSLLAYWRWFWWLCTCWNQRECPRWTSGNSRESFLMKRWSFCTHRLPNDSISHLEMITQKQSLRKITQFLLKFQHKHKTNNFTKKCVQFLPNLSLSLISFFFHVGSWTAILWCCYRWIGACWCLPGLLPHQEGKKGAHSWKEVLSSRQDLWWRSLQDWHRDLKRDGSLRQTLEGKQSSYSKLRPKI